MGEIHISEGGGNYLDIKCLFRDGCSYRNKQEYYVHSRDYNNHRDLSEDDFLA